MVCQGTRARSRCKTKHGYSDWDETRRNGKRSEVRMKRLIKTSLHSHRGRLLRESKVGHNQTIKICRHVSVAKSQEAIILNFWTGLFGNVYIFTRAVFCWYASIEDFWPQDPYKPELRLRHTINFVCPSVSDNLCYLLQVLRRLPPASDLDFSWSHPSVQFHAPRNMPAPDFSVWGVVGQLSM